MLFVATGLSLTALWTCVAHTGYFVLCAVLLSFLRCPGFCRAALLLTVPLNAVAEVNQQPALDLSSLTLLLITLSAGRHAVCMAATAPIAPSHCFLFLRLLVCESASWLLPDEETLSWPTPTMRLCGAREAAALILRLIPTIIHTTEVSSLFSLSPCAENYLEIIPSMPQTSTMLRHRGI